MYSNKDAIIVIVSTKSDLVNGDKCTCSIVKRFAEDRNLDYFETSSKNDDESFNDPFMTIINKFVQIESFDNEHEDNQNIKININGNSKRCIIL